MISSITVTYNPDIECLRQQLLSVCKQVDLCVIVDNGSNNIIEIKNLNHEFDFYLIQFNENYGLAYAQNRGIEYAMSLGTQYLLLLDQDSILKDKFSENMKYIYTKYNVGILGPSFYDPQNNKVYFGTCYKGPFISRKPIGEVTDVTFVIASGSFFSSDVFKKIGGMKSELFVDYIDVEWSLRAKNMGYRVCMTNRALMAHTIGDSRITILGRTISVHSPLRRYYLVRNSFYMLRLHYVPMGYKIREIFFNFLRSIISLAISDNKVNVLTKIGQGIYDGIRGRYGNYKNNR
ncbi:glycosyltransferase family 2 protein [Escherichia whittamii]|uniref:Glycosyltransferase family 2 protein n=2 Tax=Escherichia whittamii TaxID=2762229 RepID=A0ABR8THN6_9ESCH|nr:MULTISPECIES: glycosyltransferase family 2 protein [Escherichia]EEZ4381539.1 glycosyltransferase family 2 protein [Escherichia coli]MBD7975291.1 glycosyltransferase family 2 protein [Escherichia whittamii]MCA4889968.1 glycosyltransferase family 2 protein [Escherichia whittamii]MEB7939428.1 glycosyltransferase family 2 protein [Escherichia whittamii]MEC9496320.1 glycosyltransferase family 2 protein [Escherichia whittamii]